MRTAILAGVMTLLLASAAVIAGPLEDGKTAAQRGDSATALRLWMPLAEQGVVAAQFNLGFMYDNGLGVPPDYAQAMQWYRQAAEQGYADAQYSLGSMYANGRGVPRDDAQAVQWYRKAAGQGFAGANNSIGLIYGRSSWHYVRGHIWQFILATLLLGMGLAVPVRRWLRRKVTV